LLCWEEGVRDVSGERWWLARANFENQAGARDFFIAADDLSGYLVGIVKARPDGSFRVIAASPLGDGLLHEAIVAVKGQIAGWLSAPQDLSTLTLVQRWRQRRFWIIARANTPLAVGACAVGAFLGLLVALVTLYTGLAGWPMAAAALVIGASGGLFLKFLADRKPRAGASPALAGSWGRFAVVTVAAIFGAGIAAGSVLTLFSF